MMFMSIVKEHEGWCRETWLNRNQVDRRLDGGITGFFRNVKQPWWLLFFPIKVGSEFHGILRNGALGVVESTRLKEREWAEEVVDRLARIGE